MKKKILPLIVSLLLPAAARAELTLTGLDVLEREGFKRLEGKRVGLITNHSSIDQDGRHSIDVFHAAGNFTLAAIYAPEHGYRGTEQAGVYIDSSSDPVTGVPVFSLYGKGRQRPAPEMLKGIDVLVFDIQDIGARFYTYLTTMGYAMEEAAKAGIPFIVLDRPNPIGGLAEGPLLDPGISAFTAYFPVPTRHGLTAGEMALFHKANKQLPLQLDVVKMENWTRDLFFDQTGVVWTNPSPNIRRVDAEVLYPGIGCFEATNPSVGRGTPVPFLWFGAPWMKAKEIADGLARAGLKGVRFSVSVERPDSDVYANQACPGVAIEVTNRANVRALDLFAHAAWLLKQHNPAEFVIKREDMRRMTGSDALYRLLEEGAGPAALKAALAKDLPAWRKTAEPFLLYK